MSTDAIVQDVQKLAISSGIVELFELQVNTSPDQWIYFTSNYYDPTSATGYCKMWDIDGATIRTYYVIPASIAGFEYKTDGPLPQPKLTIANVLRTATNNSLAGLLSSATYEDILGMKFRRRKTLKKYLYNVSTTTPAVEFASDLFYLDRIENENERDVTFTLVSPFDLTGVTLPRRTIIGNMCPWEYQGAGDHLNNWEKKGGCTWSNESKITIDGVEHRTFVNQDDEYIVPSTATFTDDPGSGTRTLDEYYQTDATGLKEIEWGGAYTAASAGSGYTLSDGNRWQAAAAATTVPADNSSDWNRIRVFSNYTMANAVRVFEHDEFNSYVLDGQIESISISNNGSGYTSVPDVTISAPGIGTTNGIQATGTVLLSGTTVSAIVIDEPGHGYVAGETVTVSFSGGGGSSAAATNPTVVTRLWHARREGQTGTDTTKRVQPGFGSHWTRGDVCGKKITSCKMRFGFNPLITLAYDNQTTNFTAAKQLTGGTSTATATIMKDTDAGATGTLTLSNVSGTFQDGETITDDNGTPGSATVNGTAGGTINSRGKIALRTLDKGAGLPHGGFPAARRMGR
jgi:lambda family phage minor tail protein L